VHHKNVAAFDQVEDAYRQQEVVKNQTVLVRMRPEGNTSKILVLAVFSVVFLEALMIPALLGSDLHQM